MIHEKISKGTQFRSHRAALIDERHHQFRRPTLEFRP